MEFLDIDLYSSYRKRKELRSGKENRLYELWLPMLLFGGIGAITWAIRGTSGWGGFDGAIIHSMIWGILWFYILYLRGIDGRSESFWLGFGCSIGGMWGYAQYVSWIQGNYNINNGNTFDVLPISPFFGFLWFFLCGVAWLGIGGIFLGWALGDRRSKFNIKKWVIRIAVPIIMTGIGYGLTKLLPSLFFPKYDPLLFTEAICPECMETISTNTTNFMAVMWWVGALLVAWYEKDKKTLICGLVLGIGFGFGFGIAGLYSWGYTYFPGYIDWWKMYEVASGLFAGFLYAIILYWFQIEFDKKYDKENANQSSKIINTNLRPENKIELHKNLSIIATVGILLLIAWYGASYRAGIFLGFYDDTIQQYTFPLPRLMIFLPVAIGILGVMIFQFRKHWLLAKNQNYRSVSVKNIHEKLLNILLFINFVGILTIWTATGESAAHSKIGIVYAIYCWISLYAYYKLSRDQATIKKEVEK